MKKLLLLPLALSLSFCKCTTATMAKSNPMKITSTCPENGVCTIVVEKNKSLVVKTDDLGGVYYQLIDDATTSVIHYQYNRTVEEGLQDGNHREEIIFEIKNETTALNLANQELQQTKMLFGRQCYCKGMAGNFKVEEGILTLDKKDGRITFNLEFKVNQVPQLFATVSATALK
jgi:hypothetical protein